MFDYLDYNNINQETIDFLSEKKVFNIFNHDTENFGIDIHNYLYNNMNIEYSIIHDLYELNDGPEDSDEEYENNEENEENKKKVDDVYFGILLHMSPLFYNCYININQEYLSLNVSQDYTIYNNFFKFIKELHKKKCITDNTLYVNYLYQYSLFLKNYNENLQILREIYKDLNCIIFGDTNKKDEIKKYINNIKVNYSEIKDDEKYFHNDECPISFEKFNDDDLVILFKMQTLF